MKATEDLRYSLRFLSGKNQGGEYVLADPGEVTVGRTSEADLVLVEGMVSREHARFRMNDSVLIIEDLGSTNGTYVNGEKIHQRTLYKGDRVLVGTSILKVVLSRSPLGTKPPPPSSSGFNEALTSDRNQMAGGLDEVSVPELLEMFASARQKLRLEVNGRDGSSFVTMADGKVIDCTIARLPNAPALKCVLRLLGYQRGSFAVLSFNQPNPAPLDLAVPELLVDGLFKLDEVQGLRQRLPSRGERVVLAKPMNTPLSALLEAELDILQLAHNNGDVDAVLDQSPETDLEAAKALLSLLDRGYLRRG